MRTPTKYNLSEALVKRVAKVLADRSGGFGHGIYDVAVELLRIENVSSPRRSIPHLITMLHNAGHSHFAISLGREAASRLATLNEDVVAFRRSLHNFLDPEIVQASDKRSSYVWTEEER